MWMSNLVIIGSGASHVQSILGICEDSLRILVWSKGLMLLFGYFQQDSYRDQFFNGGGLVGFGLSISFPFTQVP